MNIVGAVFCVLLHTYQTVFSSCLKQYFHPVCTFQNTLTRKSYFRYVMHVLRGHKMSPEFRTEHSLQRVQKQRFCERGF